MTTKFTAVEYVEMLATLDRQIAGVASVAGRDGVKTSNRGYYASALTRWRLIRKLVAEAGQPADVAPRATPLTLEQADALRGLIAAADAAAAIIGRRDDASTIYKAIRRARTLFKEPAA
jgi:hypothetical protein